MKALTTAQIQAIAALWDASDPFAQDTDIDLVDTHEQRALIAARDMMGCAFPADHPIYGNTDYYGALQAIQRLNVKHDGLVNMRRKS